MATCLYLMVSIFSLGALKNVVSSQSRGHMATCLYSSSNKFMYSNDKLNRKDSICNREKSILNEATSSIVLLFPIVKTPKLLQ